jgi:hypothetical protein
VRADVDIPLRKFKITLLLKRNLDISPPTSHVVKLTFHLLPDFAGGGIGNVPGILTKSDELARGTALAGLSVKVTDGFFVAVGYGHRARAQSAFVGMRDVVRHSHCLRQPATRHRRD